MSDRFYREASDDVTITLTPFEAKALRNQLRGIDQPLPIVDTVLLRIAAGLGASLGMSEQSIKPCPFCAEGQALSVYSCGRHAVTCGICFTEGPSAETPAAALEGWNTRSDPRLTPPHQT